MSNPITHAGATVSICATPQNDDLDDHATLGFPGLTYVPIANVGNLGEYGYNTNMVNYPTFDRNLILKAKGQTDGGTLTIECAHKDADPGQLAATAAGDPDSQDNYAFKIEFADGRIHYVRGPVGGPNHPSGGNEDFVRDVYTVGVNQILRIAAP